MNMTMQQELVAAARGTVGVLFGRREAVAHFDLTARGLAGSFIAFIVAATFNAYLPGFIGDTGEAAADAIVAPSASIALLMVAVLFVIQTGFGAIALRQFGRLDGLLPYLVADNWATLFVTGLSALMLATNISSEFAILLVGVLVLISEINISRLIVGLRPMQIAMFLIAQLVGVISGLMLLGTMFPGIAGG